MHRHLADTLMVTLSLHVALTKLPPETFAFLLMALIHGRTRADALRRLTVERNPAMPRASHLPPTRRRCRSWHGNHSRPA